MPTADFEYEPHPTDTALRPPHTEIRTQFETAGYVGPVSLFSKSECRCLRQLIEHLPPPVDWSKGQAVSSRVFFELGAHDAILNHVAELLGENVMLWGASILRRRPGKIHPWHTDIETSGPLGGTVSVWIGLTNTNCHTSLQLISHSHSFGTSVQEQAFRAGKQRNERTTGDVEEWAREREPESVVKQFDMSDGDGIYFDGRIWHGSDNTHPRHERTAIVLQYAVPERSIRIPVHSSFEWPFRFYQNPKPACIMVRGSARRTPNRIVAPPLPQHGSRPYVSSFVEELEMPLEEDEESGWKRYHLFRGPTACMRDLSCHVSVLSPGTTPHEPHSHDEEEILVVLNGEAELVIVDEKWTERIEEVEAGKFAYYPAHQVHTLRNTGGQPVTYMMFKWVSATSTTNGTLLKTSIYDVDARFSADDGEHEDISSQRFESDGDDSSGFNPTRIFEGPTRYLHKLQAHFTTLAAGHGYPPHVDAYDVAIVTLSGIVETLGRQVGPNSIIFYAAGEPHGMTNVGDIPARYLVFEFHGTSPGPRLPSWRWRVKQSLPEPVIRLMRSVRTIVRRL